MIREHNQCVETFESNGESNLDVYDTRIPDNKPQNRPQVQWFTFSDGVPAVYERAHYLYRNALWKFQGIILYKVF